MQYKENVFIDVYVKRPNGRIYRDVRFHVGNECVNVENLLVTSNDEAYIKAKKLIKKTMAL